MLFRFIMKFMLGSNNASCYKGSITKISKNKKRKFEVVMSYTVIFAFLYRKVNFDNYS